MRDLRELDNYPNIKRLNAKLPDMCYMNPSTDGAFAIFKPEDTLRLTEILVIASAGLGWDHVSISLENRIPTWEEMSYIAKLFFKPDEYAVQYHVPAEHHININPFVLHWWRPRSKLKKLPIPPKSLV